MASGVFTGCANRFRIADRKPLWQYAEKLDDTYCAGAMPLLPPTITPSMHGRPLPRNGCANQHERKRTGHFDAVLQYNAKDITEKQ